MQNNVLCSRSWSSYQHFTSISQPPIENKKKQKLQTRRVKAGSVYCGWVDGDSRMQEITSMTTVLQLGVITPDRVTHCRFFTAVRCLDNFCSCLHSSGRSHGLVPIVQVKTLTEELTGRITLWRDKISHTKGELSLQAK